MDLSNDHPAITCVTEIGDSCLPTDLVSSELPIQLKPLEKFNCGVYGPKGNGPSTLHALRWGIFRSKNLEGEMLPPTGATLMPHIMRENHMVMREKSYITSCPSLPPVEQSGWHLERGVYVLPPPKSCA